MFGFFAEEKNQTKREIELNLLKMMTTMMILVVVWWLVWPFLKGLVWAWWTLKIVGLFIDF